MTDRIRGRKLQAIRARHFRYDPLCRMCKAKGIIRAWTQLDHIVPLFQGGEDTDENRQGLCDDCHSEKTRVDLGQRPVETIGLDGYPVGG